jgi:uncharacterized membrane protein YqjE
MIQRPLVEKLQTSEPAPDSTTIDLMNAIRILRSAGRDLFAQAVLHVQLARVEWVEEKNRMLQILVIALLGFACLLCVMLFAGALVLAFTWETVYRIPAVLALITVYGIGTCIALRRIHTLSGQSSQAFAASREELAADIALIRSKL